MRSRWLSTGEVLPMDSGHHAYTRFEPAGVVAAIAPVGTSRSWLGESTWKVAPALAVARHTP